jgi:hypothetical protein
MDLVIVITRAEEVNRIIAEIFTLAVPNTLISTNK